MNDLYFLVHLMHAMQDAHLETALRRAFHEIVARSEDERYRRGYRQFLDFMALVDAYHAQREPAELPLSAYRDLRLTDDELAWLLDELASVPELKEVWDRVTLDLQGDLFKDEPVEFALLKEFHVISYLTIPTGLQRGSFPGVTPGVYAIALASGQVIWEENLTLQDLCWEYGTPDTPLSLAAGGGEDTDQSTRQSTVLNGHVVINVYAGRTAGRVEVELCKS